MTIIQLSSLEKVFLSDEIKVKEYNHATALKGEKISYQIAFKSENQRCHFQRLTVNIKSPLKDCIKMYNVVHVPSQLPAYSKFVFGYDDDYLTVKPGLFPDALIPINDNYCEMYSDVWSTIWIEINLPADVAPGTYPIEFSLKYDDVVVKKIFTLEVLNVTLPLSDFKFTQWFHTDCLYTHYNVKPFSEEHWKIIENFAKMAVDNGMTMILTPVFTPTIDIDVGGERPTNQLMGIEKCGEKYKFDFSNLERWIEMCRRIGIKYYEIPHFFTQWGAQSPAKIMGVENGEYKKLFGWENSAVSDEYAVFLNQFIPELKNFFKSKNLLDKVYFHISDEPSKENIESYKAAHDLITPLISDCNSMDALSDYEFYEKGLVKIPVVANNHIKPFLNKNIEELWTYYCCGQTVGVSNRFFAMPSYRNRIMGIQMYKYGISGFLQWGYNFYYAARSRKEINPYITTDGINTFVSGDAFSVYPGENGECYPSLRLLVFNDALQDMRALKLLEEKIGYENVMKILEENLDFEIEFDKYPKNAEYILNLREKVNSMLLECF